MEKTSEINTTTKKQGKKKDDRQKLQSLARMDKEIEKQKNIQASQDIFNILLAN